jgi:hypothetical protein
VLFLARHRVGGRLHPLRQACHLRRVAVAQLLDGGVACFARGLLHANTKVTFALAGL